MDLPSINAAFTDMAPMKASNPRVSITLEEIIPDGRRCRDAGATIVHLRARKADGSVTYQGEISLGSRQIQMPTSWQWIGTVAYSMAGLMSPRWATKLRFHSQCSLYGRHRADSIYAMRAIPSAPVSFVSSVCVSFTGGRHC